VASQRTLVASIVKSRRGVLAKKRNFLMHEVAGAGHSIGRTSRATSKHRGPFASTSFDKSRNRRCVVGMTLSTSGEFGIRDRLRCARQVGAGCVCRTN
jgi:hypothetical protein